jgi:MFS family permease
MLRQTRLEFRVTRFCWMMAGYVREQLRDWTVKSVDAENSVNSLAGITALGFTAVLAAIVLISLPPFWETNDDVGMAMMADGYGFAAYPSPTIVFSNVLYGHALAALPQIGDISRYSLVSIGLNILAIGVICRALILLTGSTLTALAVSALSGLLPLTFPQFTMLAGMLTVGGLLQIILYLRRRSISEIAIAAILLFLGYLIRSREFFLVLLLYLPFLPVKEALSSRALRLLALGLSVLILAAMLIDSTYYQRPEWHVFRELNLVRRPFTDFGLVPYIQAHPELLEGTNYSANDMALLASWWLIDPFGSDWKGLSLMLSRVSLPAFVSGNVDNAWRALASLFRPPFCYLLIPAVLGAIFAGGKLRLTLGWFGFLATSVTFALLGREPVTRVYYAPVVLLLCIAAIGVTRPLTRWALIAAIGLSGVGAVDTLAKRNVAYTQKYALARSDIATLDKSNVHVVWGATLPLEAMYPVLVPMKEARQLHLYGLGVTSLAPFALAHWRETPGGLPARLVSGPPVPFFATKRQIDRLAVYCEERHSARLNTLDARQLAIGPLFTITCRKD